MAPADRPLRQRVYRRVVKDHRNHRRLQAGRAFDRQIDRARRFRLDPIAEPTQRPVGRDGRADAGAEGVEGSITVGALNDRLDLGAVLVVVRERRKRDLGFARLAVAQDQQAVRRHAFGQDVATQGGGGLRRQPSVQRG